MKNIALIFAGGVGSRMGAAIPKQFLEVSNKPIIIHTLELFEINDNIDEIYIGCIKEYIPHLEKMIERFNVTKIKRIVPGGDSGQDTIYRGLCAIKEDHDDGIVLIHDGVRPLVSQETIDRCVSDCQKYGSAITVTPAFETPIICYDEEEKIVSEMPPRKYVYTAQAPQCFYLKDIVAWHENERKEKGKKAYENIVDSCGLAMNNNVTPHLTEGNRGNIKVTTNEDFLILISNNLINDFGQFMELEQSKKRRR